ncbi:MAG TPA: MFS transporter [Pseudonocardia sp.]|nr:MFS transporter [Pseudonocardia sp.]
MAVAVRRTRRRRTAHRPALVRRRPRPPGTAPPGRGCRADAHHLRCGDTDDGAAADEHVPSLRSYLRHRSVWSNALAFFGFSWILFMFLSWYPVFLVEEHGVDLADLAWAGSLPWIAGAIGTALGGVVSDHLVRRTGAVFATRKWIAVACLGGAALLVVPIAFVASTVGAVLLLTVALLLLYLSNVQFFALVAAAVHTARLGSVTGFVHFCANCAAIVAPVLTGFLVQDLGSWGLAFGVAAGLALLGALALAFAQPATPRETASR